jgi:hypothetical protein
MLIINMAMVRNSKVVSGKVVGISISAYYMDEWITRFFTSDL